MNFQGLVKIEKPQFYLDVAFRLGTKSADKVRSKKYSSKLSKSKRTESVRIKAAADSLYSNMMQIVKSYPQIEDLPVFYKELVKCTLEVGVLRKSLGAVNWVAKKVKGFYAKYNGLIKRCGDARKINDYRREFYGRISSLVKQIKKELDYLEMARRVMKAYPTIKTNVNKTVAIAGFPNVGKTTLLFKLTGSKPEINTYAFTTKTINVGYIREGSKKIQFMDIPGSLNRKKMNVLEKQSDLALKFCADAVIYVYDLTEASYPVSEQERLFKRMKEYGKEIYVYLSKVDMMKEVRFSGKHYTVEELKKMF